MSTEHSKRAAKFTQNVEKTTWHDATFWSVRQKRDKMAQELPEWEDLREHASEIKMHTITHLADYLDMFSKNLESRGVKVHWAKDAQEFNEIVLSILKDHNVKKMVKSKSMRWWLVRLIIKLRLTISTGCRKFVCKAAFKGGWTTRLA